MRKENITSTIQLTVVIIRSKDLKIKNKIDTIDITLEYLWEDCDRKEELIRK